MKAIINIIYCKAYQCKNVNDDKRLRAVSLLVLQFFLASVFILLSHITKAQARIMVNNDAYLTMSGGIFFVIDNNNSNAITTAGTGGNIISEDEDNKIRWGINTSTGTYTVPFSRIKSATTIKIPVSVKVDTAGIGGSGRIDFSTYETPNGAFGYENSPLPSMVTNLNNNLSDNSIMVIDRFWLVDALNYTVKPDVTLSLTYIDDEHVAPNTITESNLKAQRFDDGNGEWNLGGGKLFGTVNTATNIISGIQIEASDFFAAWTLVDQSSPLPVKLTSFSNSCNNDVVEIKWVTASEVNNDYFDIEKSNDGTNFKKIGRVKGYGNSNQTIFYSFMDQEISKESYYRLKQVDFNGNFEYSNIIYSGCNTQSYELSISPNPSSGIFNINFVAELFQARLYISNLLGEIIVNKMITKDPEKIDISHLPKGVYYLTIVNQGRKQVEKLVKL